MKENNSMFRLITELLCNHLMQVGCWRFGDLFNAWENAGNGPFRDITI